MRRGAGGAAAMIEAPVLPSVVRPSPLETSFILSFNEGSNNKGRDNTTMLGRLAQASIPNLTSRLGALCVGGMRSISSLHSAAPRIAAASHKPQNQHVGHLLLSSSGLGAASPTMMLCRFMGNKSCLKTNKSAAKRFRVRGSGSVKRNKAGMSHNTGYKNNTRKRRLASSGGVNGKSIELRMRRLIGK